MQQATGTTQHVAPSVERAVRMLEQARRGAAAPAEAAAARSLLDPSLLEALRADLAGTARRRAQLVERARLDAACRAYAA